MCISNFKKNFCTGLIVYTQFLLVHLIPGKVQCSPGRVKIKPGKDQVPRAEREEKTRGGDGKCSTTNDGRRAKRLWHKSAV
jgi:hypothetical protein